MSFLRLLILGERGRASLILANSAWICILSGLALSVLGLYAIDLGDIAGMPQGGNARSQLLFLAVGLVAGVAIALPHYRFILHLSFLAYFASVALLVFTLLPFVPESIVRPINGARSWIDLGFMNLQPAELAKVGFVLAVARYMRFRSNHRTLPGLLPPALIAGIPLGLITLQPDLGSASLFAPSLFAMLVAAGARLRHLSLVVVLAALAAPAAYPALAPHQKARIAAMVQQARGIRENASGINYQPFKAQDLVGSGGLAGVSDPRARVLLAHNYLPQRHNDFVLAVIGARFGLLGLVGVLGLYGAYLAGALLAAAACKDPFGRLTIVGLAAFIAAQAVINFGMNIGLVPVIGITLPFVSAGGSSMLAVWVMTGLMLNIALRRPLPPFRASFEYPSDDAR